MNLEVVLKEVCGGNLDDFGRLLRREFQYRHPTLEKHMRPLVIDNDAKAKIAEVIAYAENHKYNKDYMALRMTGKAGVPGDMDSYICYLQVGYKCVYTIEEQPEPLGWCHHLSVSVDNPARVPSIPAVELLMQEFGITRKLKEEGVHVWIEDVTPKAVNILAKI
jgi:hypothetical protein